MEAFGVGGIDYLDQIMLDYPGPGKSSRFRIVRRLLYSVVLASKINIYCMQIRLH